MLKRLPLDVWIGLVAMLGAGIYWRAATHISISPLDGVINAAVLPKMYAMVLAGLGALLALRALMIRVLAERAVARVALTGQAAPQALVAATDGGEKMPTARENMRAVGMLALGLGFLLILPTLGYVLSVALLVGAVSRYMGATLGWRHLAVALIAAVTFYLLFVQLLSIPLPAGFWPSLMR